MALFLVTCVADEGVYASSFRVIQASSREVVAKSILNHYASWEGFISSSIFYLWLADPEEGPTALWAHMRHVIVNAEDNHQLREAFKAWFLNWTFDKNGPSERCEMQCYQRETCSQKNDRGINRQFG